MTGENQYYFHLLLYYLSSVCIVSDTLVFYYLFIYIQLTSSNFFCVLKGELVTASKAIIEKEYQPKVIVSKTGPNPFTMQTDQVLEAYRREVEQKQKGSEGKDSK